MFLLTSGIKLILQKGDGLVLKFGFVTLSFYTFYMFIRPQLKQNSFTKFRKGRIRGVTQPISLK